ncbi:MAG TPA: hypothetical protein VMZ91_12585, partial [Candidatus Paceibacterota bacterium]|nr:hypothetical protein [Candidatus Paceibacterota bacterium]
ACAEESRSQHQNKKTAFERCTKTKEFERWLKLEIARRNGALARIDEEVDELMDEKYLKIEEF